MSNKVRLNLDFSTEVKANLEAMKDRTDAKSMHEVIRRAILSTALILEAQANGGYLVIIDAQGKEHRIHIIP